MVKWHVLSLKDWEALCVAEGLVAAVAWKKMRKARRKR
jgi:hypothetical protein